MIRTEETGLVLAHLSRISFLAMEHEDGVTHTLIKISLTTAQTRYFVIFCISLVSVFKKIGLPAVVMDADGHLPLVCG